MNSSRKYVISLIGHKEDKRLFYGVRKVLGKPVP